MVYLDFEGIEVATASFLRECVLEFRDTIRRRFLNCYPVVANANEVVVDELTVLLKPQNDVLMLCLLDADETPSKPYLLGELDPKQKVTFELVSKLGTTDVRELMDEASDSDKVGRTAWNNRLASLSKLGLVIEESYGRSKKYRPMLMGS